MKFKILTIALVLALGGCATVSDIGAYKSGIEVTQEQYDSLTAGKSKEADALAKIGHPSRKEQIGTTTTWYYDFTKIRHFGGNVNEATVLEFDKSGILRKKYKTGSSAKTGNPLLDASR